MVKLPEAWAVLKLKVPVVVTLKGVLPRLSLVETLSASQKLMENKGSVSTICKPFHDWLSELSPSLEMVSCPELLRTKYISGAPVHEPVNGFDGSSTSPHH